MDLKNMSYEELEKERNRRNLIRELSGGVETVEIPVKKSPPKETPQQMHYREAVEQYLKEKAEREKEEAERAKQQARTPASESEQSMLLKALVKETTAGNYDGPILKQVEEKYKNPDFKREWDNLRKSMYPNGVPSK